eukprot:CAMPEP_0177644058 /NCGR_PEP_ID=MMETSP0447-20121125/8476_1 /TAXON_ID=0 /ORGANISM="Stygamoeba regulata, Strain BSH-02190019" /LENGTH=354 /DNA_ID=CAMNT_0019146375 /DNA_START=60 /DNA_END=1124 /DNA_ORIENTATION=-
MPGPTVLLLFAILSIAPMYVFSSPIRVTEVVQASSKGVNIDDYSVQLVPARLDMGSASVNDTFPRQWPSSYSTLSSMRTFHYSAGIGGRRWVIWAVNNDVDIVVGLDLGSDSGISELNSLSGDYLKSDAATRQQFEKRVLALCVGNESDDVKALAEGLDHARKLMAGGKLPVVPITSALLYSTTWLNAWWPPEAVTFTDKMLQLLPLLDIISFNCYGGYFSRGDQPPLTPEEDLTVSLSWSEQTGSTLLNQFGAIRAAMRNATLPEETQFWCTETGWASTPNRPEMEGWSSVQHLRTFYDGFLAFNTSALFRPQEGWFDVRPPERIFFYSLRDDPLRPEYFGLFNASQVLAPKV